MPTKKSVLKPVKKPAAPVKAATKAVKPAAQAAAKPLAEKTVTIVTKPAPKPAPKVKPVPASKSKVTPEAPVLKRAPKPGEKIIQVAKAVDKTVAAKVEKVEKTTTVVAKPATKVAEKEVKKGAKRGPKPKGSIAPPGDADLSDIEDDLVGEPVAVALNANGEKIKPLRMKISKAKERALIKEFGLDDTVLSEEDLAIRRTRLKALIKLGKTRGYLTHGEISDHLPDKLVDVETLAVVINMLKDMGVSVFEQTPDVDAILNSGETVASDEEAEEAAEAAVATVDSEFGRTTDPVRMYMREMGTVELLTREGEIEIAKRIEGGLMRMMEAISESPATIAEIFAMMEEINQPATKVIISSVVDGFSNINEADDYVAEEDFD